jgi:hypothetical protein
MQVHISHDMIEKKTIKDMYIMNMSGFSYDHINKTNCQQNRWVYQAFTGQIAELKKAK